MREPVSAQRGVLLMIGTSVTYWLNLQTSYDSLISA